MRRIITGTRPRKTRRLGFLFYVTAAALVLTASPAAASTAATEPATRTGGFLSHITSVADGFKSRTWSDLDDDDTDAYILFIRCNRDPRVGVFNADTGKKIADELMPCTNTEHYFNFGDLPAGRYYFQIIDKQSPTTLTVNSVLVRYQSGDISA
jgi:hypothetical protein